MKKRTLVLAALWLVGGFISLQPAQPGSAPAPAPTAVSSEVGRAVLGGLVVALAPVGALVGCGGGSPSGPSRTSATAVALP